MAIFSRRWKCPVAMSLILYWGGLQVGPALAAAAASRLSDGSIVTSARQADLIAVRHVLENKWVAQRLLDYGFTPEQAEARLAALPDQDLHQLASYAHGLPAGGDALGTVLVLLLIVLLVIVILKLLNKEIVVR